MHVELEGELSAEGNFLGLQQGEFLAGSCLWLPGRWGWVRVGVGRAQLFTVQSDPDYSGADYLFHAFTGLVSLFLFKEFLSDVASQLNYIVEKMKK